MLLATTRIFVELCGQCQIVHAETRMPRGFPALPLETRMPIDLAVTHLKSITWIKTQCFYYAGQRLAPHGPHCPHGPHGRRLPACLAARLPGRWPAGRRPRADMAARSSWPDSWSEGEGVGPAQWASSVGGFVHKFFYFYFLVYSAYVSKPAIYRA